MALISDATSIKKNAANSENIKNYENTLAEMKGQSKMIGTTIDNRTSIEAIKSIKENIHLGENDLWSLCPILLYQLIAPNSLERSGCITTPLSPSDLHHDHHTIHYEFGETDRRLGKLFFFSSI